MNTGDKPAYPVPEQQGQQRVLTAPGTEWNITFVPAETGITFRERLIVAAVQGMCANPVLTRWRESEVASNAINQADAVIAAMEKEEQQ